MLWLKCAQLHTNMRLTADEKYIDPDSTAHNFPNFKAEKWNKLSENERAGRAFMYAGYHFEGDGDRQSSYRLYKLSAECFESARCYDEASRSYYLALVSHMKRFGSIDPNLLKRLERNVKVALADRQEDILNRLIIYYRRLAALGRSSGNYDLYLRFRKKQLKAKRRQARKFRSLHKYLWLSLWNIPTGYGQGILSWLITLLLVTGIVFPYIYKFFSCFTQDISYTQALFFSIGRLIAYNVLPSIPLTNLGHFVVIIQGLFTLLWLGSFIRIIVNRAQE